MYQCTVLIVENEFLIRMVLADTLADEGYNVVEAGNVLEAVAVLGQRKVDAVITDVDMPGGLSGLDLAQMMSLKHAEIPIIIASGGRRLQPEDLPGVAVFVAKPYRMATMMAMVSEMTSMDNRRLARGRECNG
jgi:DNA-binding NtrC family response regulator